MKIELVDVLRALLPLVAIAEAYDKNELDDEARKYWGGIDRKPITENDTDPSDIELYQGRGGKRLLTLKDCFFARDLVNEIKKAVI